MQTSFPFQKGGERKSSDRSDEEEDEGKVEVASQLKPELSQAYVAASACSTAKDIQSSLLVPPFDFFSSNDGLKSVG